MSTRLLPTRLLSTLASSSHTKPSTLLLTRSFQSGQTYFSKPTTVNRATTVNLHDGSFIKGTVNQPVEFGPPSRLHGSLHWNFERFLAAALVPVVTATFIYSANPILDGILAMTLVIHSHMGFDNIVTDYVHVRKFPIAGPVTKWSLRGLTVLTLIGLYEFNTNDIGLTELVRKSWKATPKVDAAKS